MIIPPSAHMIKKFMSQKIKNFPKNVFFLGFPVFRLQWRLDMKAAGEGNIHRDINTYCEDFKKFPEPDLHH